ncbi:MAG: hypothetical protein U1G07_14980 [Verrucomicrobiota bacterium]
MKQMKVAVTGLMIAAFVAAPLGAFAADNAPAPDAGKKAVKPKTYALKTCLVSDEKLGGDMGEPYVFAYKDREIKLCCKDCRKDFDKNPTKFIKKLETAEKQVAAKPDQAAPKK